jgi:hypothetical protein
MRAGPSLLYIVFLMFSIAAGAATPCTNLPRIVVNYLQRHPGWTLVTTNDLEDEDKKLWTRNNRGLCPGMAIADLNGSGRKSYVLALRRRSNGVTQEKVILLGSDTRYLQERILAPPDRADVVLVVWRASRGKYYSYETNRYFRVPHDSIIYEDIGSSTIVYYFVRGKLRSVQTSD